MHLFLDSFNNEEINIDGDDQLEGSGANPDLESSGSGIGDDEDYDDPSIVNSGNKHHHHQTPNTPRIEEDIIEKLIPKIDTPYRNKDDEYNDKIKEYSDNSEDKHVVLTKSEGGPISFFAQPGILAAIVGGALVGLLCAILVVMFIVYRMRKKDEGSYALDERKRSSTPILYGKADSKELYA